MNVETKLVYVILIKKMFWKDLLFLLSCMRIWETTIPRYGCEKTEPTKIKITTQFGSSEQCRHKENFSTLEKQMGREKSTFTRAETHVRCLWESMYWGRKACTVRGMKASRRPQWTIWDLETMRHSNREDSKLFQLYLKVLTKVP